MKHTVIYRERNGSADHKTSHVMQVIKWCDTEIGHNRYKMETMFPSWNWRFSFAEPEDATHFALKWL